MYRETFFETHPSLLTWHERMRQWVRREGYVRSPIGRIRHLPDIYSSDKKVRAEAERQAINSPVQDLASSTCLFAAVLIDQMRSDSLYLVGLIHDALLYECRDDIIDMWVPKIKDIMENLPLEQTFGFKPTVPIKVSIQVSKYWEGEE